MAISAKKLSIYALTGVIIAALSISAIFVSGAYLASNADSQNGNVKQQNPAAFGALVVSIKDAPVEISKLEVTIDSIEVRDQNSGWTNLPFIEETESVTVDLLTLQDISQDLSTISLPVGDYNHIRLHVKDATATFEDTSVIELNVPSGKIDIIVHFEINEDSTTKVLIDMTADSVAISNSHNLKPVIKATVTEIPTLTETAEPTQSAAEAETPAPTPTEVPEPTPITTETETPTPTPTESPEPTPTT